MNVRSVHIVTFFTRLPSYLVCALRTHRQFLRSLILNILNVTFTNTLGNERAFYTHMHGLHWLLFSIIKYHARKMYRVLNVHAVHRNTFSLISLRYLTLTMHDESIVQCTTPMCRFFTHFLSVSNTHYDRKQHHAMNVLYVHFFHFHSPPRYLTLQCTKRAWYHKNTHRTHRPVLHSQVFSRARIP